MNQNNLTTLGKRVIGPLNDPYIIAEIGVNHEGSMDLAKQLIDEAKIGGADAVKFQSYKAKTLASKDSPSYWDTRKEPTKSQYELFQKYDNFNNNDYMQLSDYCEKSDIDFISTPFDNDAIEFLDPLVPYFKIASADITNIPFLRQVASKRKTIIISTGASTLGEIDIAIKILNESGCSNVILLHCVLNYPTSNDNAHLRMIKGLIRAYPQHIIGYSDHTLPDNQMTSLITAWLLGALVLEKHFTHNKSLEGNDHYHAMDKEDLIRLKDRINKVQTLLGNTTNKCPIKTENTAITNARRSIVINKNIATGERLEEDSLTCKRPAMGISASHWDQIVGRRANYPLKTDHILQWKDIEKS